jgi:DNA-binding transcriptional LysR family regulator
MDLFQLETFLAVAQEGGFSRAAKKLFRTQPAISQTVRKLEADLGEVLFDRSSREGALTDAGQLLLTYAEQLLNMRGEARTALAELRLMHQGKLSIAANEYTCLYLLPVLDEFRRLYPRVKITVQRALASRIPAEVLNHNTELAVLSFRPEDPALRSVVVYRDVLAFVVPPNHPLASTWRVSIRHLGGEYFVAHNVPSPYRQKVLGTFQSRRVPLHMPVELPTIEAIKRFVGAGNGVALIPRICVESELRRGELVSIQVPELSFERKLRLVHRKHGSLSHAARAFLKVCQSNAERRGERYLYSVER